MRNSDSLYQGESDSILDVTVKGEEGVKNNSLVSVWTVGYIVVLLEEGTFKLNSFKRRNWDGFWTS